MKPVVTVYTPYARTSENEKPVRDRSVMTHGREAGERLSDVLIDLSPDRWGGQHIELFKDNYTEDCRVDLADAPTITLDTNDRYIVVVLPAATLALGAIASSAFTSFAVSAAVGFGLSFLSAALKPTVWVGAGAAARTKPSPLNQLEPPRNQPRLGSRVPAIFGKMRTWPDLIYPPYEVWGGEEGTDGRLQTLYSVYGVTEGLATLEDLYVGESPVEAVTGATVTILEPGEPLPNEFALVRSNATFANVPLTMAQDWPDPAVGGNDGWNENDPNAGFTDWIRLPDLETNQIMFQFVLPQGALQAEYKYGSSGAYDHRVTYQYRKVDPVTGTPEAAVERVWSNELKSTSPHRYTYFQAVTDEGLYEVRLRREDNKLGRDKPGGTDIDQFNRGVTVASVASLRVLEGDERVNDTTRVMIKFVNFSASSQVSVNAQSRFSCVAERHLSLVRLDGTGFDPPAATSRWIDAMYYMLTDPSMAGYPAAEIDVASLIRVQKTMLSRVPVEEQPEAGEYCALFDSLLTVDGQVQSCAAVARATLFSDGANVIAAVDADNRFDEEGNFLQAYERIAALFNRRNRRGQDLTAGVAMRAALPTEADGVEVRWIDRTANWTPRTYLYTPTGSATAVRPIRTEAKGITDWSQVYRYAAYLYNRNQYRRKSTTVNAFEEARLLQIFDSVAVVQPWHEVSIDGQIIEYDDSAAPDYWITVDQDVSGVTALSDTVRIRSTGGTETEVFDILEVDIPGSRLRLGVRGGAAPHIPIMAGIPQTQIGNLFFIATDADHEKDTWLVLGTSAQTYDGTVTLANADNRVFEDDQSTLPEYPILPFTAPRTPVCKVTPSLVYWYYPQRDAPDTDPGGSNLVGLTSRSVNGELPVLIDVFTSDPQVGNVGPDPFAPYNAYTDSAGAGQALAVDGSEDNVPRFDHEPGTGAGWGLKLQRGASENATASLGDDVYFPWYNGEQGMMYFDVWFNIPDPVDDFSVQYFMLDDGVTANGAYTVIDCVRNFLPGDDAYFSAVISTGTQARRLDRLAFVNPSAGGRFRFAFGWKDMTNFTPNAGADSFAKLFCGQWSDAAGQSPVDLGAGPGVGIQIGDLVADHDSRLAQCDLIRYTGPTGGLRAQNVNILQARYYREYISDAFMLQLASGLITECDP
jgi:hypothetical protein